MRRVCNSFRAFSFAANELSAAQIRKRDELLIVAKRDKAHTFVYQHQLTNFTLGESVVFAAAMDGHVPLSLPLPCSRDIEMQRRHI